MAPPFPALDASTNILIVEDDPHVATFIEEMLADSGMCIAGTASCGVEALSIATEKQISLALVDIRLTGPIDGIQLACLLRDNHRVPVVFLSGLADRETVLRAQTATPLAFIAKPFRPSLVFNAIERALMAVPPG